MCDSILDAKVFPELKCELETLCERIWLTIINLYSSLKRQRGVKTGLKVLQTHNLGNVSFLIGVKGMVVLHVVAQGKYVCLYYDYHQHTDDLKIKVVVILRNFSSQCFSNFRRWDRGTTILQMSATPRFGCSSSTAQSRYERTRQILTLKLYSILRYATKYVLRQWSYRSLRCRRKTLHLLLQSSCCIKPGPTVQHLIDDLFRQKK